MVPTFSSKEVFENFRKKPEYKNFFHADFEESSNDEIGGLADAFNRMKASLKIAMDMLNNQS